MDSIKLFPILLQRLLEGDYQRHLKYMARIIRIKNFKLIKRKLSIQEMLSGLSYHFGTQDEYGRMAELDTVGNGNVIVYDDNHIGRGVQIVEANNKLVELALPFPSTSYDVEVFYNLARNIARQWSSKSIVDVDYGQDVLLPDIDSLKERDIEKNIELLSNENSFKFDVFQLPSAFHPIGMDSQTLQSFGTKETYALFADYLHSRQKIGAYYCRPLIASLPGLDGVSGIYVLIEDGDIIIPVKPSAKYNSAEGEKECDRYLIAFNSGSGILKTEYDSFITKVPADSIEQFDASHWHLKPMSREFLESLF